MKKVFLILFTLILLQCSSNKEIATSDASVQLQEFIKTMSPSQGRGQGEEHDEMSAVSFEAALKHTKDQLIRLRSIDTPELTGDDLIDWRFAQSILVGRELEQERMQPWKKDPRLYMMFTGISTLMDAPGDATRKIDDLERKLKLAATQMKNGMKQLDVFVTRFQELGLFMAENGRVLFDKELKAFIDREGTVGQRLLAPASETRQVLEEYISFIKHELPKKTPGDFAIGIETYNAMLKGQYLLEYDADSLYEFGLAQFDATVAELEALARKMNPDKTWQQLAIEIKNEYPDPHKMIEVHQEWVDKSREHVLKNNLIPIPWKERVKVMPRVEYLRKTSYYGHFSFAKSKDADSVYTSEMHINPFEDQWDDKRKKEYLVEHDWGVIMVTAPHETYAGHHIQGLYQVNNPRLLRRENSISIFSEGWGLYNEQLMKETGFFPNDKILLRQLQLRLWRNARVIYDVGMHTGKMTYEDAVKLMTEKVGFLAWASQLEIDSSCASPGYFIGYFTGMMEILRMREDYRIKMGADFTLSDFHEKLLKIGSMPISLMRDGLLK